MASLKETQARIKARVWQSIAQGEIDTAELPKESVEKIVEAITEAALLEMDEALGDSLIENKSTKLSIEDVDDEDILWSGRPFLSLNLHYTITDERIRITEGLLGKSKEDVELIRIQDIDQKQSMTERMLNLGDITIRSHDSSNPIIILKNIKNPEEVHEILRRAVLNARKKHNFTYREEM
ncbi:MAG: hypothetical protein Kow0080_28210 [Candidatus Promineifilaceae bacterium]